jgi:hypothetical protein
MVQLSPTGHPNRGIDRVFETVSVVGRGLVSIAEVHAIVARAHLAKSEPEMTSDRFGFSERHGFVKASSGEHEQGDRSLRRQINALPIPVIGGIRFLVALPPPWDLLLHAKYLFVPAILAGPPASRPISQGTGHQWTVRLGMEWPHSRKARYGIQRRSEIRAKHRSAPLPDNPNHHRRGDG